MALAVCPVLNDQSHENCVKTSFKKRPITNTIQFLNFLKKPVEYQYASSSSEKFEGN